MGNKHVLIAGAVVCVALALFAGIAQASEGPIKIGVMFVDFGTECWAATASTASSRSGSRWMRSMPPAAYWATR